MLVSVVRIGVEKNNDDARRHFMSSNHHDAAREVLLTEARLVKLGEYARQKRGYSKTDRSYWEKDILKKRRRTSHSTDNERSEPASV